MFLSLPQIAPGTALEGPSVFRTLAVITALSFDNIDIFVACGGISDLLTFESPDPFVLQGNCDSLVPTSRGWGMFDVGSGATLTASCITNDNFRECDLAFVGS